MPNRWAPVEPHFKLPFLSWLPEGRRSAYVRAARRGAGYDCRPLTRGELLELFEAHNLEYTDLSRSALDVMRSVERPSLPDRARKLAAWVAAHPKPSEAATQHWFSEHAWIYALFFGIVLVAVVVVAQTSEFANYYPFYRLSHTGWNHFLAAVLAK